MSSKELRQKVCKISAVALQRLRLHSREGGEQIVRHVLHHVVSQDARDTQWLFLCGEGGQEVSALNSIPGDVSMSPHLLLRHDL